MNITKKFAGWFKSPKLGRGPALAAALLATALSPELALGQGGFDYYWTPAIATFEPFSITATSSNMLFDLHGAKGYASMILTGTLGGTANSTLTATIQGSQDLTNYTAISYALAQSNAILVTNLYFGATNGLTVTNTELLKGTITYPNATNGFATPYVLASGTALATNTGAVSVGNSTQVIGFDCNGTFRYIRVLWTVAGGTNPTNNVAATIICRNPNWPFN